MKKGKVFRLYVPSNVVLYDLDMQEVPFEVLDDGKVMYRLKGIWNQKVEAYVSRVYYAVERFEEPFVRYVMKLMCISGQTFDMKGNYECRGGRVVAKVVMSVSDKRFRELCELL